MKKKDNAKGAARGTGKAPDWVGAGAFDTALFSRTYYAAKRSKRSAAQKLYPVRKPCHLDDANLSSYILHQQHEKSK